MKTINVFWFRRDLRLEDNHALFKALKSNNAVLPIFIFDKNILEKLPKNDARVAFIHAQLSIINEKLKKVGSSLYIFFDKPLNVFKHLINSYNIETIFTNEDYEPYGIQRDKNIIEFLTSNNISFKKFKDHVIFSKKEIVKYDGTPYKVYTPYSKKWLLNLSENETKPYPSELYLGNFVKSKKGIFLSLSDINFTSSLVKPTSYNISQPLINNYKNTRDFPSVLGTSKLSCHLRFGTVSIRKIVLKTLKANDTVFLKELIWREFFMQILWHYPHTVTKSFKPKYENITWINNEEEFKKWCNGNTGYQLVDAGMRELNATGFMHNRIRMLVGSFLCKHLLIDWRWGEAYFAEKLLDFELASNVGNWQWVAGCGVDASPYFRIFNPLTQVKKFDKELQYIQKWVPEFQELTYATPIVEHKFARERCLNVYKKALT